jgi:hypothetical protein
MVRTKVLEYVLEYHTGTVDNTLDNRSRNRRVRTLERFTFDDCNNGTYTCTTLATMVVPMGMCDDGYQWDELGYSSTVHVYHTNEMIWYELESYMEARRDIDSVCMHQLTEHKTELLPPALFAASLAGSQQQLGRGGGGGGGGRVGKHAEARQEALTVDIRVPP